MTAKIDRPSLEIICSEYWLNWLQEQRISIALTTYQTNRLFLIGLKSDGSLSTFERFFERAMGLYATAERLLLATHYQIWQFDNLLPPGQLHQKIYDRLYVPTVGYTTGDLNTHELAVDRSNNLIFVNTKYSCLAKLKEKFSFEPIWQPSFISQLAPEDRCHLNGLAMVDGQPKYVTACSRSDVAAGWRMRRENGGVAIDVPSKEIVAAGLSMPHSPRWYRGQLWLNNSGTGEFGYLDLDAGKFEPVVFCPGFVRGLAFHDNYALVGMSKPRDRHFSGLLLDDNLAKKDAVPRCGIMVVDLDRGQIAHWLELEGIVKELFDVAVLPGVKQPMALGFKTDEIERLIVFPGDVNLPPLKNEEILEPKKIERSTEEESKEAREQKIKRYFELAKKQKQEGDLTSAAVSLERVIKLKPNSFSAYNNLGNILHSLGQTEKALAAWQKALEIKPDNAIIYNNLGQVWQLQEKPELALEAFKKAIALEPGFALAYLNLAKLLHRGGAINKAEQCYQQVLKLQPDNAEAHFAYGNLLKEQQRLEEAIATYQSSTKYQPNFTAAYLNLGIVFQMRGVNQLATKCYEKVLEQEPNNPIAYSNLGIVLEAKKDLRAARTFYLKALELNPDDTVTFYRLAHLERKLCNWENYAELVNELVYRSQKHLEGENYAQLLPLTLSLFDLDLELHRTVASHYARSIELRVAPLKPKCNFIHNRKNAEKLHIGYVSPDFCTHAVGSLIQDLFQHHNRDRFEIYCYSLTTIDDEITAKIKANCDRFTTIALMSTYDAAWQIYNDRIDILIDLAGYTTYSRPEIFALQPAPIQCQYLGFPATLGANFIQYILADKQLITPEMATHFKEEVIYLPHAMVGSTMPVFDRPMTRQEFDLPDNSFIFCCFNRLDKITPEVFQVWMEILRKIDRAVLWLSAGSISIAQENLKKEAQRAGIEPKRLIFASKLPQKRYLSRYSLADLFVDTFNYNAGSTGISAWQAGLPVLTLAGNTYAARMGASIATAAQQPQFICHTVAEYQEKAIYWANHPTELKELRDRLVNDRSRLPLFDLSKLASNLESACEQIWQKHFF
jgi:uncharacterized protein (TIGR03032 family)